MLKNKEIENIKTQIHEKLLELVKESINDWENTPKKETNNNLDNVLKKSQNTEEIKTVTNAPQIKKMELKVAQENSEKINNEIVDLFLEEMPELQADIRLPRS